MTAVSADKHDAAAPRLLDEVRVSIRLKHYNLRKEQAYLHWINRFIFFHDHLHPRAMGAVVEKFSPYPLRRSCFVIDAKSSVVRVLFLCREVLFVNLPWLDGLICVKPLEHLPPACGTYVNPYTVRTLQEVYIMGATVKEERIEIRLASAEKERIRQAAILSHLNISEFVLRAVRSVADEILASQTRFVLPEDQMNAFYAALDQPAQSIPRLRELLKKPSVFETQ